jgi:hypothetical protein
MSYLVWLGLALLDESCFDSLPHPRGLLMVLAWFRRLPFVFVFYQGNDCVRIGIYGCVLLGCYGFV